MTNKCYSTDGEEYNLTELGEVFDRLDCNDELVVGREYHVADAVEFGYDDLITGGEVIGLLELIDDSAYEKIGEVYDPECGTVTAEAKEELRVLLRNWAYKHVSISRYYFVKNSEEKFVTEEDISDYRA